MFEKIKTHLKNFITRLSDLRFVGQIVFVVIVLLMSWSGMKAIQTNYELEKQIAGLQQKVNISELENQNLELENEYLQTDQFLELAARQQFGKAAPGEKIYVIPDEVAQRYAIKPEQTKTDAERKAEKPGYQKNLEAWANFFFRKSDNKLLGR